MRQFVEKGHWKEALDIVKGKEFYPQKNSRLLRLMEKGSVYHLKGEYKHSLKAFDEAQELSEELYTKSVSKKLKSLVVNDKSDNYYGERFERSLIRFYQALNHILLFEQGFYEPSILQDKKISKKVLTEKERRRHLSAARSVLLEWQALLESYQYESSGKPVYKKDMMAKVFGAAVHERLEGSNELNTAKQLYKEAKTLLIRNYSAHPSFNKKFEDFKKNFSSFPKLGEKKVKKKFISATSLAKDLESYVDSRLKDLGRPKVHFLLFDGFIHHKKALAFDFQLNFLSLPLGINDKEDFLSYVRKTLVISAITLPSISFELPSIDFSKNESSPTLMITKKGETFHTGPFVLIAPLSEMAHQALQDKITLMKVKVGARVAGKHLAALGTSYLAYKKFSKSMPSLLATSLSAGLYAVANKKIKSSEQADLRCWATLPRNIWMASLPLSPGEYTAFVKKGGFSRELGSFTVQDNSRFFSLFIFLVDHGRHDFHQWKSTLNEANFIELGGCRQSLF